MSDEPGACPLLTGFAFPWSLAMLTVPLSVVVGRGLAGGIVSLAAAVVMLGGCDKKGPATADKPVTTPVAKVLSTVPAQRLERLRLGVNLSHWHWLPRTPAGTPEREAYISEAELVALAKAGATHVRLPIQPSDLWDEGSDTLREGADLAIRRAIQKCLDSGLAVIVDAHPTQQDWKSIDATSGTMARLERFWDQFGAALAASNPDPERVFLELLNEPQGIESVGAWSKAQESLLGVVRRHFPGHTVILTGDQWGSIDGLLRTTPVSDPNVVYSFHTYDPTVFTHQGATWGFEPWKHLRDVPYPLDKQSVKPVLAATKDEAARNSLKWDSREPWNAGTIRANIKRAADWGAAYGVPLYCGEFGVYSLYAKPEHRVAWLRDVTAALDEFGIGRAMWDYCGTFGLATGAAGAAGARAIDRDVARAIGLRP